MAGMYPDNETITLFGQEITWPGMDPGTGKFTNGDFSNPLVKPSFVPAETINLILDNFGSLITALGGAPNNAGTEQLKNVLVAQLALKANLASPAFTGTPTAPTAAAKNNSTQLATTAYADRAGHHVNSYYTQYAGSNNAFAPGEEPAQLFGGTWTQLFASEGAYFQTEGGGNMERANGIQGDAQRQITGRMDSYHSTPIGFYMMQYSGAFYGIPTTHHFPGAGAGAGNTTIGIDSALVVPTDNINHPKNRLIKVWKRTA